MLMTQMRMVLLYLSLELQAPWDPLYPWEEASWLGSLLYSRSNFD